MEQPKTGNDHAGAQSRFTAGLDTGLFSLDSIELAIFNHDSDGCDRPETGINYQQRRKEWASIKLFLLNYVNTCSEVPNVELTGSAPLRSPG